MKDESTTEEEPERGENESSEVKQNEGGGDAGDGIPRAIDIGPDGGIELEVPEGIQGDVTHDAGYDGEGRNGMKDKKEPAQIAPQGRPSGSYPETEPRWQQEVRRRRKVHGQTVPPNGGNVCPVDGFRPAADGYEDQLSEGKGEKPEEKKNEK